MSCGGKGYWVGTLGARGLRGLMWRGVAVKRGVTCY